MPSRSSGAPPQVRSERSGETPRANARALASEAGEHGFVMVDHDKPFDDDFEFVGSSSDSESDDEDNTRVGSLTKDGFEVQAVFGSGDWSTRSAAARSAPNGSAPAATKAPMAQAFRPPDNAFSPNQLARRVSLPAHTMPSAPLSTQLGLHACERKPTRSMTAPTSFSVARMQDSTVD